MALKVVRKERKHRIVSRASRRFHERVFVMSVLTAAVGHGDTPAHLARKRFTFFREHRSFQKTKEVLGEKSRGLSEI